MKIKLNFRLLLLFFGISVFVACKKDDTDSTQPPPASVSLQEAVVGKWEIHPAVARLKHNSNNPPVSHKIQEPSQVLSIEFLSDSTYIVVMSGNEVLTGKYNVSDSAVIDLSGFGHLSEIKIAGNAMDFKLSSNGTVIVISANKAETIPLTDNTRLLCRNWYLTRAESGEEVYGEGPGAPDKITILFSAAGTYLVQFSSDDTLHSAEIANWKWHPTLSNTFVFWWYDEPADEDAFVSITELSSNSLKIQESHTDYEYHYDGEGNITSTDTFTVTTQYVLIPANQVSARQSAPVLRSRFLNTADKSATDKQKAGIFRRQF
ncbi:hypothetical protein [Agriterribacter sp.]|uniref:hypothetical protein n=1 Tax=Agriterribacter sp. TaxID=2821509 RepID=UPI002C677F79|nr:hypothetical protein [Agriterribacter sp.]HTN05918.1 hypothetical protein [Agriterribacter sp.]